MGKRGLGRALAPQVFCSSHSPAAPCNPTPTHALHRCRCRCCWLQATLSFITQKGDATLEDIMRFIKETVRQLGGGGGVGGAAGRGEGEGARN